MISSLFITVLLFGCSAALTCTQNSQCAMTECCQILSEFMIVSKRGVDLPVLATRPPRTGSCQPYKNEGDYCNSFDKPNGYCSCAPGLHCQGEEIYIGTPPPTPTAFLFHPVQTAAVSKRSMVPPRPGYQWEYRCKKIRI